MGKVLEECKQLGNDRDFLRELDAQRNSLYIVQGRAKNLVMAEYLNNADSAVEDLSAFYLSLPDNPSGGCYMIKLWAIQYLALLDNNKAAAFVMEELENQFNKMDDWEKKYKGTGASGGYYSWYVQYGLVGFFERGKAGGSEAVMEKWLELFYKLNLRKSSFRSVEDAVTSCLDYCGKNWSEPVISFVGRVSRNAGDVRNQVAGVLYRKMDDEKKYKEKMCGEWW